MRVAATIAILVSAAAAAADPTPEPSAGRLQIVLRLGIHDTAYGAADTNGLSGGGLWLDGEIGWRRRWLSVAAFGGYSSLHSAGSVYDSYPHVDFDVTATFVEVGARASVETRHALAGVGLGAAEVLRTGSYTTMSAATTVTPTVAGWHGGPLVEVHAGLKLPMSDGTSSFQIVAMFEVTSLQDVTIYSARVGCGVQF